MNTPARRAAAVLALLAVVLLVGSLFAAASENRADRWLVQVLWQARATWAWEKTARAGSALAAASLALWFLTVPACRLLRWITSGR